MKIKLFSCMAGLCLFFTSTFSFADENTLTGDTKLACEAILCLSSGDKPSECSPSLGRYFNITKKKMSDTIKARKGFLNMCPSSDYDGMPSLINAISQGAGRCDAGELNRVNRKLASVANPAYQQCMAKQNNRLKRCEHIPQTIKKYIIENSIPSYCTAYFSHGWTNSLDSVKYVGDKENVGKWVSK